MVSPPSVSAARPNPYTETLLSTIQLQGKECSYYDLQKLNDPRYAKLPYSVRVLLEATVRHCDEFHVTKEDVEGLLNWEKTQTEAREFPFQPARVLLQDFTGVPAVVDLAAMRDAVKRLGGNPEKINPQCPVDLVIDHSVQVDRFGDLKALETNQKMEFERNKERFNFLKWGAKAFKNMLIVPPGSGIVHQVNLEYLARIVFNDEGKGNLLYPDSVVGTDSHTTMICGSGVLGWGVGGIEAEAVMLGQPISMVIPEVVGFKLVGKMPITATSTDLVLTVTKNLRDIGVVGKFVEFFGPAVEDLTIADRATIANMCPEYGATVGFFPVDVRTLEYLRQTGRDPEKVTLIKKYLEAVGLFRTYSDSTQDPTYTRVVELDLSQIVPCVSGPKRPHDRVEVTALKDDFQTGLTAKLGFKGFNVPKDQVGASAEIEMDGKKTTIKHGSVVIAAITSCTNTSNPSVMLGAERLVEDERATTSGVVETEKSDDSTKNSETQQNGGNQWNWSQAELNSMGYSGLVAKKAVELGLKVEPFTKTSLSPGSGVVTRYLQESGLLPFLEKLGFFIAGYGCMTCIGNSGPLPEAVAAAVDANDLVVAGVLSGNRNFEGRVHQQVKANYLAAPPLVVAYALAGRVDIDFESEPIGVSNDGKEVFLRDIWPSKTEIDQLEQSSVLPSFFKEVYSSIQTGSPEWQALGCPESMLYPWDSSSTYIKRAPFFDTMKLELDESGGVEKAYALLNLGDSITTDHISPAGSISKVSPAARYLMKKGLTVRDFNTYGSRRGNDEVMARGTFANIRLMNKLASKPGPKTLHIPSNEEMDVFDAAERYRVDGETVIILAGREYGSGSSRDWAAKGPYLQGVKAVIAESFERIHRSNLVGMGLIPLQYPSGVSATSLGLTGKEKFSIDLPKDIKPGQKICVKTDGNISFDVICRFDTEVELEYFRNGGILQYMIRKLL